MSVETPDNRGPIKKTWDAINSPEAEIVLGVGLVSAGIGEAIKGKDLKEGLPTIGKGALAIIKGVGRKLFEENKR